MVPRYSGEEANNKQLRSRESKVDRSVREFDNAMWGGRGGQMDRETLIRNQLR